MLEDFVQNAPIGLQWVGPDGRVLWANPAQYQLLGYDVDEYVGQPLARFYAEPALAGTFLERLTVGETLRDFAAPLLCKNGDVKHVLINANVYRVDGRFVHTRCFVRDVTDRRQLEEALAERARALAHADRLKDEFLATLSHELRTPLNAMLGWARLLRRGQLEAPKRDEAIATIERNASLQAKLIDELLDLSRIVTGKVTLDMRPIDLGEIVAEVVESVRPAAEAKGVDLGAEIADGVGPFLGDHGRLLQVIGNLVTNALKFTPPGGRVDVQLVRTDGHASITVSDTGAGIAADFLPHVFDRFRQADGSAARNHGGLGLGLAIARHLIELHGGMIVAESGGPGRGSRFRLTMPLLPAHSALSQPLAPVRPGPTTLAGLKVLVIDDDEDTLDLFRAVLELAGADVLIGRAAPEGLELLRRHRPDVLVSDIGLPGIDGYAFISAVRNLPVDQGGATRACALTAYARAEDRARVLAAGFQLHLAKPIDPADLAAAIATLAC